MVEINSQTMGSIIFLSFERSYYTHIFMDNVVFLHCVGYSIFLSDHESNNISLTLSFYYDCDFVECFINVSSIGKLFQVLFETSKDENSENQCHKLTNKIGDKNIHVFNALSKTFQFSGTSYFQNIKTQTKDQNRTVGIIIGSIFCLLLLAFFIWLTKGKCHFKKVFHDYSYESESSNKTFEVSWSNFSENLRKKTFYSPRDRI